MSLSWGTAVHHGSRNGYEVQVEEWEGGRREEGWRRNEGKRLDGFVYIQTHRQYHLQMMA